MRRFVAVVALLAVLAAPRAGAADLRALGQEKALQQQEKTVTLTLLTLDEELAARQAAAGRIRAALPGAAAAVGRADRTMVAARGALARDRRRLGLWLNFLYRYGNVSFLATVLKAKSFGDFVNRLVYVTALVEYQAGLWRKTGAQEAAYARTVARLRDREESLRQEEAGLQAAVAALQSGRRAKAAFLTALQRQSAVLARQVQAEEAGWVTALQPLTRVLDDLSGLPWTSMTPAHVTFGLTGVTLEFDDATLTRVLNSDPAAAGVKLRLTTTADGIVISGDPNGVPFALRARLAVAGPRAVRLVPRELDLDGLAVQDATLRAVTGGDLTFELPGGLPQWKLTAIKTGPHRTDFVFGP